MTKGKVLIYDVKTKEIKYEEREFEEQKIEETQEFTIDLKEIAMLKHRVDAIEKVLKSRKIMEG